MNTLSTHHVKDNLSILSFHYVPEVVSDDDHAESGLLSVLLVLGGVLERYFVFSETTN